MNANVRWMTLRRTVCQCTNGGGWRVMPAHVRANVRCRTSEWRARPDSSNAPEIHAGFIFRPIS
jgi:hypothetical protein